MDVDESFQPEFSWRRAPVLLADRLGARPVGLLGGALAVLAAGLGAWWALRPPPPPADEVLPFVQDVSTPASTAAPAATELVVVHVDGAVGHPGVHELRVGARVSDAIDAAGGLSDDADRRALNLAQLVGDGQRIWVPRVGEDDPVAVVSGGDGGGGGAAATGLVSLSTASASVLEGLPGIGPSLASAIVEHRAREGGFETVDDLLAVAGIGPAKLDAIRELVVP
ncbi:MAG: helix-hairpin-helix domain-containing protein [Actinomycetota bacterium]